MRRPGRGADFPARYHWVNVAQFRQSTAKFLPSYHRQYYEFLLERCHECYDHGLSHPPNIRHSLSNSGPLPSNLSPWPVTVTFGSRLAAPGAHRSRSIVRSGILHFLHLIVRHPSMLRSIELPPWKIENRSTTMRTIGGSPERIINYFVTFSAMPFD